MSRNAFGIFVFAVFAFVAGASSLTAQPLTIFSIAKTGAPDPVLAGANLTYTITAGNNSSGDLKSADLADTLPAGTTFVSLAATAGWTCTTPAMGAGGTVSCMAAPFSPGDSVFSLVVQVSLATPPGTLGNQASLTVTDSGRSATQVATANTTVLSPPVAQVPTLGAAGLAVLALLLAIGGVMILNRL